MRSLVAGVPQHLGLQLAHLLRKFDRMRQDERGPISGLGVMISLDAFGLQRCPTGQLANSQVRRRGVTRHGDEINTEARRAARERGVEVLSTFQKQGWLTSHLRKLTEEIESSLGRAGTSSKKPQRHKLDHRIDGELVARVVAEYEAGTPTTQLTRMFSLGKGSILKILREAGVELRLPRMSAAELELARQLYESGLSLVDVSKQLGRPGHSTVYQALKRSGVRMRDSHGRG